MTKTREFWIDERSMLASPSSYFENGEPHCKFGNIHVREVLPNDELAEKDARIKDVELQWKLSKEHEQHLFMQNVDNIQNIQSLQTRLECAKTAIQKVYDIWFAHGCKGVRGICKICDIYDKANIEEARSKLESMGKE